MRSSRGGGRDPPPWVGQLPQPPPPPPPRAWSPKNFVEGLADCSMIESTRVLHGGRGEGEEGEGGRVGMVRVGGKQGQRCDGRAPCGATSVHTEATYLEIGPRFSPFKTAAQHQKDLGMMARNRGPRASPPPYPHMGAPPVDRCAAACKGAGEGRVPQACRKDWRRRGPAETWDAPLPSRPGPPFLPNHFLPAPLQRLTLVWIPGSLHAPCVRVRM